MEKKAQTSMAEQHDPEYAGSLREEINSLKKRVKQETEARLAAERLLEAKSSSLDELRKVNERLKKNIFRRTSTLSALIKNLHSGVLLEDENRRVMLTNTEFCEIFGLKCEPDELVSVEFTEKLMELSVLFERSEDFLRSSQDLVDGKQTVVNEVWKMTDGKVLVRDFLPIYLGDEYLGHLWQFREVTEEFYYEEKIRQSEEKYRGIIENMELGLLEVDANHQIVKAYDSFCEMVGYTNEELDGQNMLELLLPEPYHEVMLRQDEQRRNGKHSVYEVQMKRKDGKIIWVLAGGSPFYDEEGKFCGSLGIHYNITDRKRLENDLREARVMAEQARDAEKQFLANMSHEIRNPINAIAGIINLLYDTKLSEEQLDYLNNIKYAADILLGLISDILDLSKIEAGKMEINERNFDFGENIRAIIKTYGFKTSDKAIEFSCDVDDRFSRPLFGDPTVINQILLNLIGNAVKFTDNGGVHVRSHIIMEQEYLVEVETSISDTGIGISEDQLEQIFETFHQGNKQTKLKYGGTGLGLTIVRQLLKIYDGSIRVSSEPGKGSTFTFTVKLPRGVVTRQEPDGTGSLEQLKSGRIRRVLVVEDNKINQQYLIGLLKKWGLTWDLANNGVEALEFIEINTYDLVLMDIRMPVMDGYETTIRIRSYTANPNCKVPIIALTASALVDEKARALEAGMNFHLTKPFSPGQLLTIFNQISDNEVEMNEKGSAFQFSEELDREYLKEFYEDDLERAALMFNIFLSNIDAEIEDMGQKFEARDWTGFTALSHRIKPNFAMVGLSQFTELMKEFERFGKSEDEGALKEIVPKFFQEFKNKVKLVERELSRMNTAIESNQTAK